MKDSFVFDNQIKNEKFVLYLCGRRINKESRKELDTKIINENNDKNTENRTKVGVVTLQENFTAMPAHLVLFF